MLRLPVVFMFVVIGGYLFFVGLQMYMGTPKAAPNPKAVVIQNVATKVQFVLDKKNWKGNCSFPRYIPERVQQEPWFPLYLSHLQRVSFSAIHKKDQPAACSRWWYPTAQLTYHDEVPHRGVGWKAEPKPKPGYIRPNCNFGQTLVKTTTCAKKYGVLWRKLDKMGVLYFPRSGSELGIVRGSTYLTSDGDVDVFVDMPQKLLIKELRKSLSPLPHLSGRLSQYNAEVHWKVKGCAEVHMVFNDWISDETVNLFGRPTHMDACNCMLNSVPLTCHREGIRRMYIQYGPSWRAPLHAKALDVPWYARSYNIVKKLRLMVSADGIIREEAVRALGRSIKYSSEEMHMILAQLNVLKALIDYQKKTKDYNFI